MAAAGGRRQFTGGEVNLLVRYITLGTRAGVYADRLMFSRDPRLERLGYGKSGSGGTPAPRSLPGPDPCLGCLDLGFLSGMKYFQVTVQPLMDIVEL